MLLLGSAAAPVSWVHDGHARPYGAAATAGPRPITAYGRPAAAGHRSADRLRRDRARRRTVRPPLPTGCATARPDPRSWARPPRRAAADVRRRPPDQRDALRGQPRDCRARLPPP